MFLIKLYVHRWSVDTLMRCLISLPSLLRNSTCFRCNIIISIQFYKSWNNINSIKTFYYWTNFEHVIVSCTTFNSVLVFYVFMFPENRGMNHELYNAYTQLRQVQHKYLINAIKYNIDQFRYLFEKHYMHL